MNLDLLTGRVFLRFSTGKKDDPTVVETDFPEINSAKAYLTANMRDFMLGFLDDFVNHKKHIIEAGNHIKQAKALEACVSALYDMHQKRQSLLTICTRVIAGWAFFVQIMPDPNNNSYQSSLHNLDFLKQFCENVVNRKFPIIN